MYTLHYSQKFKKSYKKLKKSGKKKDVVLLKEAVAMLEMDKTLPGKYRNHFLSGTMSTYQECHIKDDLLLVYYKDRKNLILILLDVGSHQELFGK